jgi:hypothetical protein
MLTIFAVPALAGLLALPAASGSPALTPMATIYPDLEAFYIEIGRAHV